MSNSPAPQRGPETRDELVFFLLFTGLFLGLMVMEVVRDYEPVKRVGLSLLVFWVPLLVLHELGHAVAAWVVGRRVIELVIGFGKPLYATRVGTCEVVFNRYPVSGYVRSAATSERGAWWRAAFVYLAGPGVEIVLALAIIFAVGADRFFEKSGSYGVVFLQGLALAALIQGVVNLIPHVVKTEDGDVPNDGLGFLLCTARSLGLTSR
jgi:membrane-associated protease RseP (regulator of RpoE activity)